MNRRSFASAALAAPLVLNGITLDGPQARFRNGTQVVEMPKMDGRCDGDLLDFAAAIRGESKYGYSLEHDLIVQACVLQASEMV